MIEMKNYIKGEKDIKNLGEGAAPPNECEESGSLNVSR